MRPRIITLLLPPLLPLSAAALQKATPCRALTSPTRVGVTLGCQAGDCLRTLDRENLDTKGQVQIIQYIGGPAPQPEKAISPLYRQAGKKRGQPCGAAHHVTRCVKFLG